MPAAQRRNSVIAAVVVGFVIVVGLVAERRYSARTPPEQQAKLEAVQPRTPQRAANGSSMPPSAPVQFESSAPAEGTTAMKPVVIGTVKPWAEIARMPQYVQASSAERMSVRDLYWRTCVEDKLPPEQRTSAYWQFVRDWEGIESGATTSPTFTTSGQLLREQQPRVPSPVDSATMERWCRLSSS